MVGKKSDARLRMKEAFFKGREWRRLRFQVLVTYGVRCMCCGATPHNRQMHVDHIKPISKHWDLRLDPNNLQVLCDVCNEGKSNLSEEDLRYRKKKRQMSRTEQLAWLHNQMASEDIVSSNPDCLKGDLGYMKPVPVRN